MPKTVPVREFRTRHPARSGRGAGWYPRSCGGEQTCRCQTGELRRQAHWRRSSITRGRSWCRQVKARRGLPPHRYAADPVERPAGWPQNARSWTFVDPTPPARRPASPPPWDLRVCALSSGSAVGGLLPLPAMWNRWWNAVWRASEPGCKRIGKLSGDGCPEREKFAFRAGIQDSLHRDVCAVIGNG